MKLSALGIGLILIGALIIGVAYVDSSMSLISIQQSTESTALSVLSSNPSSTAVSSPTIFSSNTATTITVNYGKTFTDSLATSQSTGTGSVSVSLIITNESSSVQTTESVNIALSVSVNKISLAGGLYEYQAVIKGIGSYTFNNPYSSGKASVAYGFQWGSATSSAIDGFVISLPSSSAYYGQFPAQSPTNIGNFWVGTGLNNMTEITSTSQVVNIVMPIPGYLYVIYAEDNGKTGNFSSIYYSYQISYSNNNTNLPQKTITLTATQSWTSPSGATYTIYTSQIYINGPMDLTIQGYLAGTNGQSYQLMELAGNFTGGVPIHQEFTMNQLISFAIGGLFIVGGLIVIFKR
jgi:hypothetical protein